jgi:hypothetical protein
MCRCRYTNSLGRIASRLTVVMGLAGFLVVSTGLPVVQPVDAPAGKDTSKPFPCQNRPCGCTSQDECMRGCCCFSASQRLAWAKEHDVEAPAELVALAEREHHDGSTAKGCCAVESQAHGTAQSACHHAQGDGHHEHSDGESAGPTWRLSFISGVLASHCRGLGPLSAPAFSALPPAAAVSFQFDWCPTGWIAVATPRASSANLPSLWRPPCA